MALRTFKSRKPRRPRSPYSWWMRRSTVLAVISFALFEAARLTEFALTSPPDSTTALAVVMAGGWFAMATASLGYWVGFAAWENRGLMEQSAELGIPPFAAPPPADMSAQPMQPDDERRP